MAKRIEAPPFKLSQDDRTKIEAMSKDLENTKKASAALKELGMDTKDLDSRIALAEKQREILLREFS